MASPQVGDYLNQMILELEQFRERGEEPPTQFTLLWKGRLREAGVSEKAFPLALALAQSVTYGDDG